MKENINAIYPPTIGEDELQELATLLDTGYLTPDDLGEYQLNEDE